MLSTSEPSVCISRTASRLAFLFGLAVDRELVRTACHDAKSAGVELVEESAIEQAVQKIDLIALYQTFKATSDAAHTNRKAG